MPPPYELVQLQLTRHPLPHIRRRRVSPRGGVRGRMAGRTSVCSASSVRTLVCYELPEAF
jgi:hypothetical protein